MKLKMVLLNSLIVGFLASSLVACANHWREGDVGVSAEQVSADLANLSNPAAPSVQMRYIGTEFQSIMSDPNKQVFYTENNEKTGPLAIVAPIDFFELSHEKAFDELLKLRAYFIVQKVGTRYSALLIFRYHAIGEDLKTPGTTVVYTSKDVDGRDFYGDIQSGTFKIAMTNQRAIQEARETGIPSPLETKIITVYSSDVNSDQDGLSKNIQLEIYDETRFLGKISTLVGM